MGKTIQESSRRLAAVANRPAACAPQSAESGRGQRPAATVFLFPDLENAGKMDVQLEANVENQNRTKCGKNDAGGMKSFVCRVRKHVGNRAADDRSGLIRLLGATARHVVER